MSSSIRRLESQVRSYCRSFPVTFETARGSRLFTRQGKEYIDFFAGAGALNYGHNHPYLKAALLEWIEKDGICHSLDMFTVAKERFLESFERVILVPRGLEYKVMFTGPTGTNAVEAALKLARKTTERTNVVAFTNAFHGMTLGSLAATGNQFNRDAAGLPLQNVTRIPYDGYQGLEDQSLPLLESLIMDDSSGVPRPAGILLETVQAEGGVNPCSMAWLQEVASLAKKNQIPLIVDDIQTGCGRTGSFFSFEQAGIVPDMVCLSKSLSGFGLPFAVVLIRPELDIWQPGEHNGTFRGHNPAFVTATAALHFWRTDELVRGIEERTRILEPRLEELGQELGATSHRGRGMIRGLEWDDPKLAGEIAKAAFERGLVMETAGADGQVLKFLAPLNIPIADLEEGLDILETAARATIAESVLTATA